MNYSKLYKNNADAVVSALSSMWCGEAINDSQRAYGTQIKGLLKNLFAPEDAIPVVQCMNSYLPVHSVEQHEAESLVGNLWQKVGRDFSPYEHQYLSWKALSEYTDEGKPKSIVVTTGTGSGKTECFMLPLVHDLLENKNANNIQAIFLYPLNALMEDQKERMEQLLKGTDLTYTVYNSNLPEKEPAAKSITDADMKERQSIEDITGGKYVQVEKIDENGETKMVYELRDIKFERMLYTREQIRKTPPNILLTNPTMLEYIMLRKADEKLINPEAKSLRWIVIDETHSYTGAGAAELAMLLRRVMLAFDVNANDIRFATSSATFGGKEEQNPEESEDAKLKKFIAGVTGLNTEQIEVIDGERVGQDCIPEGEDGKRWRKIFDDDFVKLDELYPGSQTIEEKLQMLDDMCQREEDRCKIEGKAPDLKLKVHYFYRVPNNGLFVNLEEHENGAFKIYTENNVNEQSETSAPILELSRCNRCGEYVAIGIVDMENGCKYEAPILDDSDMFDLPEDEEDNSEKKYFIFGLSKGDNLKEDYNLACRAKNGQIENLTIDNLRPSEWHVVANTKCYCPYCNTKLTKQNTTKDINETDTEIIESIDDFRPRKFRLSAEFISRLLAPSTLDQMDKVAISNDNLVMHDGQQYLSFVDSRQAAAKATLNQNETQERLWLYTIIYHELCRRLAEQSEQEKKIESIKEKIQSLVTKPFNPEELNAASKELKNENNKLNNYMTWEEIADLILNDKYFNKFCSLFAERSKNSEEIDEKGNVIQSVKEQYVQSLMVEYLANRPANIPTPETMGLFHSCYPQLEKIHIPKEVEKFNELLVNQDNKITDKDWRNFLQVYMDYNVRSNQSFFLRLENNDKIDIFSCERFATEKPHRRPVKKPILEKGKFSTSRSRYVRYLCALIRRENEGIELKDIYDKYFNEIEGVIDALWNTLKLKEPKNNLLEQSQRLNDNGNWQNDSEDGLRFNLVNLSFKLYEDVYICDTSTNDKLRHVERLRPIENNFKGFSPYLIKGEPVELSEERHEQWKPYPYYSGNATQPATKDVLEKWAKENRSLLMNHGLWGVDGIFAYYLQDVHLFPNLFIQAEHTAQIDRSVARTLQGDFKEHTINILACSTTMEMGVDLGDLELVMLTSVPPMPANYKQRAGRSGRNNKVRSACVTLCGSDAIGLNTLYNPIDMIIRRPVCVPSVDLKSPQVVQRHVNAFLVREFGVFSGGENGGSMNQKVFNYYTTFHDNDKVGKNLIIYNSKNEEMGPKNKLGDNETGTMYELFNEECNKPLTDELKGKLERLLCDTIYEGMLYEVLEYAREANERCYIELSEKLEDYKVATENATTNFLYKLKFLYYERLSNRLLNYWATSRFTPNANMPVNIISLDLNPTMKRSYTSSNPSYSLREALSQYAPGNTMVRDGVVHMVRGVETSTLYGESKAFKQMYHDSNRTTIDENPFGNDASEWSVNNDKALELIQPAGFLSDPNESKTRVIESNVFTHVSSQLIDADEWSSNPADPHLLSIRPNRNSGNAKIIYYNEGIGFGYCYCTRCGRAVLEESVADKDDPAKLPSNYNPQKDKKGHPYHKAISGSNMGTKCSGSYPSNDGAKIIRRNVIIGDLIQTDYSEIRIRLDKTKNTWVKRKESKNLLYTLGIVLSQALVNVLGKERNAVDFTIMQNGHICIFDTNPGGAGYANQLANALVRKRVLSVAQDMLLKARERNSKDMLLDKFSIRYINYIDIDGTLDWITKENDAWEEIPDDIATMFEGVNVVQKTLAYLRETYSKSVGNIILFVDDDFEHWNYDAPETGWKKQHLSRFQTRGNDVKFCILKSSDVKIKKSYISTLHSIKGWTHDVISQDKPKEYTKKGLYPLAYMNGELFLTNEKEHATLNEQWGNAPIFVVKTKWDTSNITPVDCEFSESAKDFILKSSMPSIKSSTLGETIYNNAKSVIDSFIKHCNSCNDDMEVCYQDKYLRSVFGIVITLQTIDYFAKLIGKDFSLEFKVEKYEDYSKRRDIQASIYNSSQRNTKLEELTNQLIASLKKKDITCSYIPKESLDYNVLTHWRDLSFKCGGKTLSIRPDGGIANGWHIIKEGTKKYKMNNTTLADEIPMGLKEDIRFSVSIDE